MIDLLRPVPGAQIPTGAGKRWAREIERLARDSPELADQADPSAQVEAGIRYALGPRNVGCEFEVVVRSGKALREKWPQLVARARRERAKSKAQSFEGFAERIARGMT